MTNVVIPDGVKSIGNYTFSDCSSLTNINIPDSVKSVGDNAFDGCSSLANINIPKAVTSISKYAFRNCSSLETINYSGTMKQWEAITKGTNWKYGASITKVICSDGEVSI